MVVAADQDARVIKQLKRSAEELGLDSATRFVRLDLLGDPTTVIQRLPKTERLFDLVFVDAPYAAIDRVPGLLEQLVLQGRLLSGAWIAVERPANHHWRWPNGLAPDAEYRYGQTGISLGAYEPEKGIQ